MGYEDAKSTKLLATNCLACGRPLRDAVSVETGIGPLCREKYGYSEGSDVNRDEANALIQRAAAIDNEEEIVAICKQLRDFGYSTLPDIIEARFVSILIRVDPQSDGTRLTVEAPYNVDANKDWYRLVPGSSWDKERKIRTIPNSPEAKKGLFNLLRRYYSGSRGSGPKGIFSI